MKIRFQSLVIAVVVVLGCDGPDIADKDPIVQPAFDGGTADSAPPMDAALVDGGGDILCNPANVEFIPGVGEGAELEQGESFCELVTVCVAGEQTASMLMASAPSWQCKEAPNGGPSSRCRSPEFDCAIDNPGTVDSEFADVCAGTLLF